MNSRSNWRRPRSGAPVDNRNRPRPDSNSGRDRPKNFQNAQRSYERYLALAEAEVLAGNRVGAENYYQHAEHYFRSMSSDPEAT